MSSATFEDGGGDGKRHVCGAGPVLLEKCGDFFFHSFFPPAEFYHFSPAPTPTPCEGCLFFSAGAIGVPARWRGRFRILPVTAGVRAWKFRNDDVGGGKAGYAAASFAGNPATPTSASSSRLTAFFFKATFKSGQCSDNQDKNACSIFLDSFSALAFAFGRAHSRNASTQFIVFGSLLQGRIPAAYPPIRSGIFPSCMTKAPTEIPEKFPDFNGMTSPCPRLYCVRPKTDSHHCVDFRQGFLRRGRPRHGQRPISPRKHRSSRKRGSMEMTLTAFERNSLFPSDAAGMHGRQLHRG